MITKIAAAMSRITTRKRALRRTTLRLKGRTTASPFFSWIGDRQGNGPARRSNRPACDAPGRSVVLAHLEDVVDLVGDAEALGLLLDQRRHGVDERLLVRLDDLGEALLQL